MKTEPIWTDSELEDERVQELVDQILAKAPAPAPLDWRTVTAAEAPTKWRELATFVQWVVTRYQLPQNEIPHCWYQHGSLTEELSALHGSHEVCFDPTQIASAASDWHRVLYETRMRLREWAAATNCQINDHRPGKPQRWAGAHTDDPWQAEFASFVHRYCDELERTELLSK